MLFCFVVLSYYRDVREDVGPDPFDAIRFQIIPNRLTRSDSTAESVIHPVAILILNPLVG